MVRLDGVTTQEEPERQERWTLAVVTDQSKSPHIFYGWWLLGAGTMVLVLQGGLFTYGFAAFFVPLAAALGTSRTSLSFAFSFIRLESGLLGPVEGFFIDRFGPRGMMFIGFAIFGLSFILFSRVDSLMGFYLVFPLVALGASMSGFLPVVTAVTNWFHRRRGFATGVSAAGVNIGGVAVFAVAMSISTWGWRPTALAIGVLVWIVGIPLSAAMRHKPQPYGYLPDGDPPSAPGLDEQAASSDGRTTDDAPVDGEPDFTPMQAIRTAAFWFVAVAHAFSVLIIGAVTIHEIPLLMDAGISFETASAVLAFMTGVAVVGRIAGGYLGDRFGRKPTIIVCFFMMSAGVIILAFAQTVPQALIFAVLYGLGYGARAPLLIALRGDFFGPRNFATIMGLSQPVLMIGSFLGPLAAGYAYDVQGNYRMVMTVMALVILIGAVLVLFIKKPDPPKPRAARPTEAIGG